MDYVSYWVANSFFDQWRIVAGIAFLRRDFPYFFRHENLWDKPFSKGTYFFCWLLWSLTFAKQLWWVWDEFPSWTWSSFSFIFPCVGVIFLVVEMTTMDFWPMSWIDFGQWIPSDPDPDRSGAGVLALLCLCFLLRWSHLLCGAADQTFCEGKPTRGSPEEGDRGTGIGTGRLVDWSWRPSWNKTGREQQVQQVIKSPWRLE